MNYQLQQQPSSNISISNLPQSNMIGSNNNVTTTTSTTKSVSFNPSSTNLSSSTASSNMTKSHSTSELSAQNINTKTKTLLNNPNTSIIGNNPTISNNTVSNTTANNATSTATTSASNNNNSLVSSTSTNTNTTTTTTTTSNNNTTRVKVVVRVRPQVSEDISNSQIFGEYPPCVATVKNTVILKRECYDDREFTFDKVLEPTCSQDEMYKQVGKNIVNDVLKGYNGTVLAYGQTGSGKTFTIFGSSTDPKRIIKPNENIIDKYSGVIPRCINQIFEHVQEYSNNTEFRVFVSFMQIYMENIMDLLDASKTNLPIREDPKNGVFVEQLTQVQVNEPYEVMQLIKEGSKNRQVNSTNMNKLSSRSHVILMITVEQKSSSDKSVKRGVLHIVDLAGSERVFKSGSEGQRLEEAKKINKSLSALGNCVAALTEENVYHVPFRDSKLTRLLTDSLGGNAKTCLVATIGPSMWNYDESYSTLHFANRAMNVKNHAIINEVVDFKILSGNLQKKINVIENEKVKLMERNVDLERQVNLLRSEISSLSKNSSSRKFMERGSWEDRERELIDKFGNVIRHLQMEIAKQNIMFNKAKNRQEQNNQSDESLERVIDGFLSVPNVKQRIIAKLVEQGEVKEISPWSEEKSPQRADDVVNSILRENSIDFNDNSNSMDSNSLDSNSADSNDSLRYDHQQEQQEQFEQYGEQDEQYSGDMNEQQEEEEQFGGRGRRRRSLSSHGNESQNDDNSSYYD
ncbi:kinesin [Naegleria gruberi]|uniref:Kinesin-like protein n=1 Tax=Naegleria gruberi TaxID=5762 RepID=D2W5Y5_NAEGR|nr:kinesin [Naegleria gruberi]EFC35518.1 kinesin [Naegleria gruberi]|eukprot:XP_002668262.1 kinesin [Naegleria gruberi]